MRKWIPLYAALIILLAGSTASAAAARTSPAGRDSSPSLSAQVNLWVESLSNQPEFAAWKEAETSIVPIGPGQHGWLVTLRSAGKPVGYLIVNAKVDGGYQLGEYGAGSHPAFDPNTLYQSMVQQGLIESFAEAAKRPLKLERLYVHPLLAVWKWKAFDGQTVYLDAWTGEALPIDSRQWQNASPLQTQMDGNTEAKMPVFIASSRSNYSFDPYETMPWLSKKPLSKTQVGQLTQLLDGHAKIRFTAELYEQNVRYVWPAVGYHRWDNNELFIAFDQMGARYVPLDSLSMNGAFFND